MRWKLVRKGITRAAGAVVVALATCAASSAQGDIEGAWSREVVVYASAPAVEIADAYSRTAVVRNSGETFVPGLAASRESVVYNSEPLVPFTQSHSRESVLYVSESPIVDAFSREVVVFDGYYVPEAFQAIRIAGGLEGSTPAFMERLQMAFEMSGQTRINLAVAAQVLRIAVSLTP